MIDRVIDLDHASTTQVRPEVVDAMLPFFTGSYGNAGSPHRLGVMSNKALNQARRSLARALDADDEGIYFTSGATEANNWAILGVAYGYASKGKHIITTKVEHPSVLMTCKHLEKNGFQVTYLSVDSKGRISLEELENSIRKDTTLVSVMMANNETGVIQPIREISELCRKHQVLFHTDAVQAFGKIPVSVRELKVDLLTISGHKIYGPKGIGCLYIRKYLKVEPLLFGGHQQNEMRAGTEPVPEIVGFAKAAEFAMKEMEEVGKRTEELLNYLRKELQKRFENIVLHFNEDNQLPSIINISFVGMEAEQILVYLDLKQIYVSGGSACTSKDRKPSYVLQAMGCDELEMKGAIRISLGRENTKEDIDMLIEALETFYKKTGQRSKAIENNLS